jgi:RNA polymerase sigma-70 factor (ECF subfamily)
MLDQDVLSEQFEANRAHLQQVAYRMLGSLTEAEDAVQEAWLRLSRTDTVDIENPGGWLTTVVARICIDMLRSRKSRQEESLEARVPEPIVTLTSDMSPEQEAVLADSVGLAMLVVLDTLTPAERVAFVMHDMFDLPFEEIATMLGRTPQATRQLASRARRRVQGAPSAPDKNLARQREVVDAFLAASRRGDFDALVAVLDPQIVLRADAGSGSAESRVLRGATAVATQAARFRSVGATAVPALVNGAAGVVTWLPNGEPFSVVSFTVANGKVVAMDIFADPARVKELVPPGLEG